MLTLSAEQEMIVQSLKELAKDHFAESAYNESERKPRENLQLLAEQGFLGINFDEKYGGGGMSEFESMLVVETLGKICPDTTRRVANTQMVTGRELDMFGTEAMKEKYLPPLLAGEEQIALAISEPEAGSDVKSMTTTVERKNGELVLNGEKTWVSFVPESRACVIWAKFPEGLGTVVIEFDWNGVEISETYTNMAGDPQTHFFLEDVVIPEEHVCSRGEESLKEHLKAINWERLVTSSFSNAIAEAALELSLDYAQDRKQFGQPIGDFQGIEWKLADMAKQLEVSKALCHKTAMHADEQNTHPNPYLTAITKVYAAEMVEEVVSEALQIHGANGYMRGHPLEYLYRLARGRKIGAGTNEVNKNFIAGQLKKKGLPSLI